VHGAFFTCRGRLCGGSRFGGAGRRNRPEWSNSRPWEDLRWLLVRRGVGGGLGRAALAGIPPGELVIKAGTPAVQRLYRLHTRLHQLGSFTENLWRIRHTRPESPQLDSRAGGEKSFWLICARALAAADSIVHED
jgi:hypothetical protein